MATDGPLELLVAQRLRRRALRTPVPVPMARLSACPSHSPPPLRVGSYGFFAQLAELLEADVGPILPQLLPRVLQVRIDALIISQPIWRAGDSILARDGPAVCAPPRPPRASLAGVRLVGRRTSACRLPSCSAPPLPSVLPGWHVTIRPRSVRDPSEMVTIRPLMSPDEP